MSLADVAKLAGVSNATISRVINGNPGVSPETADAVRKAMDRVGYKPSARRPGPKPGSKRRESRSGPGDVLFLVFASPRMGIRVGFEELLRGVSETLSQQRVGMKLLYVDESEDVAGIISAGRPAGILAHGDLPDESAQEQLARYPTVWLMANRAKPPWGDQVMPSNEEIGVIAARYLAERGHRHLAFLNLQKNHRGHRLHAESFERAARDLGCKAHRVEDAMSSKEFWSWSSPESGEALAKQLLDRHPEVTGVFIADDAQAAVLQPCLVRVGAKLRPEGEFDLISCNNERAYLVGLQPCPATIDIRLHLVGARAASQLLWRLASDFQSDRMCTTIEPRLVLPPSSELPETKASGSASE